jgi:hypothetical protein
MEKEPKCMFIRLVERTTDNDKGALILLLLKEREKTEECGYDTRRQRPSSVSKEEQEEYVKKERIKNDGCNYSCLLFIAF